MAHETAIHRHDARSAHGTSGGEADLFRQTDGDRIWYVRFGTGGVVVE
jgi:hypothetical protein